MSGIGEIGGLPGANTGTVRFVQPKDIDMLERYIIESPSVSATYMALGTGSTNTAFVIKSAVPDYPRNFLYQVTGGTTGGTFTVNGFDQFGSAQTESVVVGTAATGGSASGTAIWGSISSGTFFPIAANTGTASIGFGTKATAPSTAGGNYFGLPVKIGAVTDIKAITWVNSTTPTAINGGTNFGSLVSIAGGTLPPHAFQGTSGVAATDKYVVSIMSTWDNIDKGNEVQF